MIILLLCAIAVCIIVFFLVGYSDFLDELSIQDLIELPFEKTRITSVNIPNLAHAKSRFYSTDLLSVYNQLETLPDGSKIAYIVEFKHLLWWTACKKKVLVVDAKNNKNDTYYTKYFKSKNAAEEFIKKTFNEK